MQHYPLARRPSAILCKNSSFRGGKARRELVIQMAATKEKKNADLVRLTDLLNAQETMVVAAVNYKGLSVRNAFLRFHVTRFFRPSPYP